MALVERMAAELGEGRGGQLLFHFPESLHVCLAIFLIKSWQLSLQSSNEFMRLEFSGKPQGYRAGHHLDSHPGPRKLSLARVLASCLTLRALPVQGLLKKLPCCALPGAQPGREAPHPVPELCPPPPKAGSRAPAA